jgi:hypothetical protein
MDTKCHYVIIVKYFYFGIILCPAFQKLPYLLLNLNFKNKIISLDKILQYFQDFLWGSFIFYLFIKLTLNIISLYIILD